MPAKRRRESTTGFYHVIVKGINKEQIFAQNREKSYFRKIILKHLERYEAEIYCYCIMSNHAHFIIRAELHCLSSFMAIILAEYAMYYTLSSCYENWKNSVYIQATIQNIGADKYSTMPITVPSIDEQKEIVSYLNERTTQIMRVIAELEKQVEDLTKYRIAIISEAVTGKIDLRNWNPEK